MSKRKISFLLVTVMSVAVLSVFAVKALAVPDLPPSGTFIILTYDPATGLSVPNVPVTIRQLRSDSDRVPAFFGQTDDFGKLYHSTLSGTYRITATGGSTVMTGLGDGDNDHIVTLFMN